MLEYGYVFQGIIFYTLVSNTLMIFQCCIFYYYYYYMEVQW